MKSSELWQQDLCKQTKILKSKSFWLSPIQFNILTITRLKIMPTWDLSRIDDKSIDGILTYLAERSLEWGNVVDVRTFFFPYEI